VYKLIKQGGRWGGTALVAGTCNMISTIVIDIKLWSEDGPEDFGQFSL